MALSVTPTVRMASLELVQSAGRTALMTVDSVMMVPTATSLMPTVVVPARFTSVATARSGVLSGTLNVTMASTMLAAASALLTAPRA